MRPIAGLSDVVDRFDGFILDLWGVIHDGQATYPQVVDTLRHLRHAEKKTLLLSNAPRRAHALIASMTAMGIPRDLYGEVLSSGEVTRDALIARADPFFSALGEPLYHLGPDRDVNLFEGTGVQLVPLNDATGIVNTGPENLDDPVDKYDALLAAARTRDLPMVCANPDIVVIRANKPVACAGAIAARYTAIGGRVAYRGKPDRAVYEAAIAALGLRDRQRIAVVGDALETDIKGALGAALPSIWCTGGIHADALGVTYGIPADPARAARLAADQGYIPDYVMAGFHW